MKRAGKVFNFIVLLIGLAMIGYYFALGVAVRFGQSLQYLWLLGGLLCVARFLYWRHAARSGRYPNRAIVRILRVLFCLALAFFLAVEGVIVAAGNKTFLNLQTIDVLDDALAAYERVFAQLVS